MFIGGDEEDRTLDLTDANRTLSQLSYVPTKYYSNILRQLAKKCKRKFSEGNRNFPALIFPQIMLKLSAHSASCPFCSANRPMESATRPFYSALCIASVPTYHFTAPKATDRISKMIGWCNR